MTERLQKITFGDLRDSGVHGVVVYCSDYRCAPGAATLAATLLGLRQRLGLGFTSTPDQPQMRTRRTRQV
jgi:hypothetical protein